MSTTEHTTTKRHIEPTAVRHRLSKRVDEILAESLHLFEEVEEEIKEHSFDVDGILAGRPSREAQASLRRSSGVRKHVVAPSRYVENAHILTRPSRGSFIPSSHFTRFA